VELITMAQLKGLKELSGSLKKAISGGPERAKREEVIETGRAERSESSRA